MEREYFKWQLQSKTFIIGSKTENLSPATFVLIQDDSIVRAEILQALHYLESNYSFRSAGRDSE